MNLVLSSTGFNVPNYQQVGINKDNLATLLLNEVPDFSIDNLVVHRCLHLLNKDEVEGILARFFTKIKPGGKLTIYCIDVYFLAHKIHRRECGEMDFDAILYENGQKNCLSTLYMLNTCIKMGFTKSEIILEDIFAKMEFIR